MPAAFPGVRAALDVGPVNPFKRFFNTDCFVFLLAGISLSPFFQVRGAAVTQHVSIEPDVNSLSKRNHVCMPTIFHVKI
jgi:hypothetical protein